MKRAIFIIITVFLATGMAMPLADSVTAQGNAECSVEWFAEDTITQGDWYHDPQGSPTGAYGCYAYILPNPPENTLEVPIGDYSVPIGSYSAPPYNWTSSQIAGLAYYQPNPPYWDEYYSESPAVSYNVSGTQDCDGINPRALLNEEDGGHYIAGQRAGLPAVREVLILSI